MKHPIVLGLLICITFIARSQQLPYIDQHPEEKPALFASLPDKFSVSPSLLKQLFTSSDNNHLSINISKQFIVEGIVLEKVKISAQQESINIRCTNYANALLNISIIRLPNNKIRYTGRIISPKHGDVLTLVEEKEQYYFTRQKQLLTMVQ
jgi:hypothetical protein